MQSYLDYNALHKEVKFTLGWIRHLSKVLISIICLERRLNGCKIILILLKICDTRFCFIYKHRGDLLPQSARYRFYNSNSSMHSLHDTFSTSLQCTVCTISFFQLDASFNIQGYVANKFVCSFPITGLRTRNLARENRGSLLIRHGKLI